MWFTGLRRQQAKTRANLQPVESFTLPSGKQLRKLSPLADWHTRDVWQYAERHGIPLLPLYDLGYSSIGCEPCTSLPTGDDPRSGRWGGAKVECGIHIQPACGRGRPQGLTMEVALGFLIAFIIAITGVGAGTITAPLLILVLHVPVAISVGTALGLLRPS